MSVHESRPDRERSLPAEHVHLGDGLQLAWCVGPDGRSWPWVLVPSCPVHEEDPGCSLACCAPHEQLGRLPDRHRLGLEAVPVRCGAPRKDGQPCRAEVTPGTRCRWHRLRLVTGDS